MKTKYTISLIAAVALAIGRVSSSAQSTNLMLYNFNTDQVTTTPYGTAWGNWFGGYFQGVTWDSTSDSSNNPSSGSLKLNLNCTGSDQYVLNDGINPAPSYNPLNLTVWTNLSFDIRYDASSAIRTNAGGGNGSLGPGSLDYGYMRVGSRSPGFAQDWIRFFAISATNGAGLPNTNWTRVNVDLRQVAQNFSDLSGGLVDLLFGMDGGAYGNSGLVGTQTLWIDNIQLTGEIPHPPPPTMSIVKATPSLTMFGGSGLYGRSQVALVDTNESWIGGTFPVSYSFTILDNATSPGALQTGIQFIGGNPGNQSYQDYGASNVLWLRIISGTGTNTACVADVSWKTNAPGSNPDQHNQALVITNPVLAGTWTLTFGSDTSGTLTAPGASPVPFTLALADSDAIAAFSAPIQVRFGHENFGNTANGGVPHYWANISVSGTAGTHINEDFTKEGTSQLDTNIWNLNTSDGTGVVNLVPTNAPYWIKWTTPDAGFTLVSAGSLSGATNWNEINLNPILQSGTKWALVQNSLLPAGNARFFALLKRPFTQLQVLLPGETNAPGTLTGKIGTPTPITYSGNNGVAEVTINAVDPTFHIVSVSGDVISVTSSDTLATLPTPAPLVNGTVTQQLLFNSTGNFTVTATDTTSTNIPPATSSSVSVGP